MSTTTAKDLQRAVEGVAYTLEQSGLIPPNWRVVFEEGSQTYGRAHRLYMSPPGSGALHSVPGIDDYAGWTRAEAYQYLSGISSALSAVRRLAEGDDWICNRAAGL